jgi:hypothetical protein
VTRAAFLFALAVFPDAGVGARPANSEPELRIYDAKFDGHRLDAMLLVCAGSAPLLVDAELSAVFRIVDARRCEGGGRAHVRAYDLDGAPVRVREVPASTCVGQHLVLPVNAASDPANAGCIDLHVGAHIVSAKGKSLRLLRATVRTNAGAGHR